MDKLLVMYKSSLKIAVPALFMFLSVGYDAWALDIDPTTYFQQAVGVTALQFQTFYSTSTNLKLSGSSIATTPAGNRNNSRVEVESAFIHYTQFFEVDEVMVDPHILVPYTSYNHIEAGGHSFDGATGWSDPLLAVVIAPIHAPDNSKLLAVGLGVYPPTGQYERGKFLNPSQHRWEYLVQLEGVKSITPQLYFMSSFDVSYFTKNDEAGTGAQTLTQEASYEFQPWLQYRPTDYLQTSIGYAQYFGGKQRLNGAENGLEYSAQKIRLEVSSNYFQSFFLILSASRDMVEEGGYRESLRLLQSITYFF